MNEDAASEGAGVKENELRSGRSECRGIESATVMKLQFPFLFLCPPMTKNCTGIVMILLVLDWASLVLMAHAQSH